MKETFLLSICHIFSKNWCSLNVFWESSSKIWMICRKFVKNLTNIFEITFFECSEKMFVTWKCPQNWLKSAERVTQVPRISYPLPRPFTFFYIGDHFFYKRSGVGWYVSQFLWKCCWLQCSFKFKFIFFQHKILGTRSEPPGIFSNLMSSV